MNPSSSAYSLRHLGQVIHSPPRFRAFVSETQVIQHPDFQNYVEGINELISAKCLEQQQLHKWALPMLTLNSAMRQPVLGEGGRHQGQEKKP